MFGFVTDTVGFGDSWYVNILLLPTVRYRHVNQIQNLYNKIKSTCNCVSPRFGLGFLKFKPISLFINTCNTIIFLSCESNGPNGPPCFREKVLLGTQRLTVFLYGHHLSRIKMRLWYVLDFLHRIIDDNKKN